MAPLYHYHYWVRRSRTTTVPSGATQGSVQCGDLHPQLGSLQRSPNAPTPSPAAQGFKISFIRMCKGRKKKLFLMTEATKRKEQKLRQIWRRADRGHRSCLGGRGWENQKLPGELVPRSTVDCLSSSHNAMENVTGSFINMHAGRVVVGNGSPHLRPPPHYSRSQG